MDNFRDNIAKDNKDELTDNGKFTKYFWRLHFVLHLFKV